MNKLLSRYCSLFKRVQLTLKVLVVSPNTRDDGGKKTNRYSQNPVSITLCHISLGSISYNKPEIKYM